jgi:monoamine oxidase
MVAILDAVIIGAGAAGLTASYELARNGLNIKLLEASGQIGGRVRKTDTFTDFPLDLGGAWIHVDPSILDDIVNDANVPVDKSKIVDYKPDYRYYWGPDKSWNQKTFTEKEDHLFINSTWFDFFHHYIAPASAASLELNCVVDNIDSTSDMFINVTCKDGRAFQAKNVVVTTSIAVLKRSDITFLPDLPTDKKQAIQNVKFDDGFKTIFKFSQRFYDQAFDAYYSEADDTANGDRYFFDATYGQSTDENILGVFIRGEQASSYINLGDDAIKSKLLSEIDLMYDGKASQFYLNHTITNWSKEPFVGCAYSNHGASDSYGAITTISSPISMGRIYFAGEALEPNGEYGYVHGAALTGQTVAQQIMEGTDRGTSTSASSRGCVLTVLPIFLALFIASV